MYAHLATMSTPNDNYIIQPMNALPKLAGLDEEGVKDFIRKRILNVSNRDLIADEEARNLAIRMGSDLAINAFAVNFRIDGVANANVVEANNLNKRIFERLSIVDLKANRDSKPLILTSTVFGQVAYGESLTDFKTRLELDPESPQDLYTLVNVVMSPWPTMDNLTGTIVKALKGVVEEEVKISLFRNTVTPDLHGFVMQGTDRLYLVHLAMYNMENHRYQLIITGDLPEDVMKQYTNEREKNPQQVYILGTAKTERLSEILKSGEFGAVIHRGIPPEDAPYDISYIMH